MEFFIIKYFLLINSKKIRKNSYITSPDKIMYNTLKLHEQKASLHLKKI